MIRASIAVEEALLVLKVVFLVLLYLFIWRIVRSAVRDVTLPQESFILAPGSIPGLGGGEEHAVEAGKLDGPEEPRPGRGRRVGARLEPTTLGRGAQNDVPLDKDEYASSSHARIEPRRDGVWVEDIGSTNGTYLNGIRLTRPKRLTPGDVVRVGETELRYDA